MSKLWAGRTSGEVSSIADISPTTVEAVLGNMVRTGSIRKIGSSRAIRYIKA